VAIDTCIQSTRNGGTTILVGAGGLDQQLNVSPPVLMTMNERRSWARASAVATGAATSPLVALWRAGRSTRGHDHARRPSKRSTRRWPT